MASSDPSHLPSGEEALILERRGELLQVQGVAFRRLAHVIDDSIRCRSQQVPGHPPRIRGRQRWERRRDRARLPRRPRRVVFEELGPGQAQEEHRAVDPLGDRVGQVEHRPLRPMQILEQHHQGPLGRDHLEQASNRPGRLRSERLSDAEDLREAIAHRGGVRLTDQPFAEPLGDLVGLSPGASRRLGQQLDQRREGDAVAVGGSLPDEDRRQALGRLPELRGQSRLPDAGRRQDRDENRRRHASIASRSASRSIAR